MTEISCLIAEIIVFTFLLISELLPFSKCEPNGILHAMWERIKKRLIHTAI